MKVPLKKAFEKAATENYWNDPDSLSGSGSNLTQTRVIRKEIPLLLEKYGIKKMLDAPCGDLFWMKEILPEITDKGIEYNGADIVPMLIEKHRSTFKSEHVKFHTLDLTSDAIPRVDLIFTRDCFIHLSFKNIISMLQNYKKSKSKYLLVSTYINADRKNIDVKGFYLYGRMLNLEKYPFNFKKPLELIVEECTEGNGIYSDKSLGLWRLSEINVSKIRLRVIIYVLTNSVISIPMLIRKSLKRLQSTFFKKGIYF